MREHGTFKMEIIDQTLVVRCFDAWNLETVLRMCKEYKDLVETIHSKPWACIVDLSQWELSTPEMWDEIDKINIWGNANNQRYEAVICSLSIQRSLLETSHLILTNVNKKFCDNIDEAFDWLSSVNMLTIPKD